MDIRALTFDVFGTTVDWRSGVAREAQRQLEPKGYSLDWNAIADRWRAGYLPAMAPVRDGKRPWVTFEVLHREILDGMAGEFGLQGLTEAERDDLNLACWRKLDPWPDTRPGMTRLAKMASLIALSNGSIAQMIAIARHGDLRWDAILGAQVSGTYKPDPKLYKDSVRILGLAPEQVMMVAAHTDDLKAAAACGLRTAYVHRADEYGPGNERRRPEAGAFDIEVDSFEDLAAALGG